MVWTIVLGYLAGITLLVYLIIRVFIFISRGYYEPATLLAFVLMAMAIDILSTVYFVHILGLGWELEGNAMVRQYGNSVGHLNALLINHFLLFSMLYFLGVIFKKWPFGLCLVYRIFILLFSSAVLINLIFPTLTKIFNGHT